MNALFLDFNAQGFWLPDSTFGTEPFDAPAPQRASTHNDSVPGNAANASNVLDTFAVAPQSRQQGHRSLAPAPGPLPSPPNSGALNTPCEARPRTKRMPRPCDDGNSMQKRQKNKEAAAKCRAKSRQANAELEELVRQLEASNRALRDLVNVLNDEKLTLMNHCVNLGINPYPALKPALASFLESSRCGDAI